VDTERAIGFVAYFGHFGLVAGNTVCVMNEYFYIPI